MWSLFPFEPLYFGSSRYLADCWTSSCRWRPSPWQPGVSWRPSTRCTSCCCRTSTPSWQWTRPPGTNSKNAESWMGCHSVSALTDNSSSWGRVTRASGSACCHSPRTWRRGAWKIQRNYPTSITGKVIWRLSVNQSVIMEKERKSLIMMFYIVSFIAFLVFVVFKNCGSAWKGDDHSNSHSGSSIVKCGSSSSSDGISIDDIITSTLRWERYVWAMFVEGGGGGSCYRDITWISAALQFVPRVLVREPGETNRDTLARVDYPILLTEMTPCSCGRWFPTSFVRSCPFTTKPTVTLKEMMSCGPGSKTSTRTASQRDLVMWTTSFLPPWRHVTSSRIWSLVCCSTARARMQRSAATRLKFAPSSPTPLHWCASRRLLRKERRLWSWSWTLCRTSHRPNIMWAQYLAWVPPPEIRWVSSFAIRIIQCTLLMTKLFHQYKGSAVMFETMPALICYKILLLQDKHMSVTFLTRECDSNEQVIAVSGGWNSLVPCLLTMAIVSYCGPEPIRRALVSIFRNSLRKCRSNWNAFWIWAPRVYTDHRFNRELLGRMFTSVHLHPTSSGTRLDFRRRTSCGFWRSESCLQSLVLPRR